MLHGGYGLASHTYGLAVDFIEEATVVLANSSVVKASTTQNTDLFWALRGAGFSYGIVTGFKFRTIAAPSENFFFYRFYPWNITEATAALLALQKFASSGDMPREFNMRVVSFPYGPANVLYELQGVWHGPDAEESAGEGLRELWEVIGEPAQYANGTFGWLESLRLENNNDLVPQVGTGEPLETGLDYDAHSNFVSLKQGKGRKCADGI